MDSAPPPPHWSSSTIHFPPNSSSSSGSPFPILAIAIVGILSTALLLVGYYVFVIKCCLNWHGVGLLRRFSPTRRRSSEDPSPAYAAAAVPRGLDESLIRLIPVIRFRKEDRENRGDEEEAEYLECAVCLSDFREGEKLRVIPNCCHAFHIDCIDVWLQNNANCPLCRCSISSNTLSSIDRVLKNSNLPSQNPSQSPNPDRFTGDDDDFVVIEIQGNNLDEPRLVRSEERAQNSGDLSTFPITTPSTLKVKQGKQDLQPKLSMDDECIHTRAKDDEFHGVQPIRRSISMDLSSHRQLCLEIREVSEQSRMQGSAGMTSLSSEEEHSNGGSSSSSSNNSSRGLRRSFFSFGNGRGGSRNAVLPLQLGS